MTGCLFFSIISGTPNHIKIYWLQLWISYSFQVLHLLKRKLSYMFPSIDYILLGCQLCWISYPTLLTERCGHNRLHLVSLSVAINAFVPLTKMTKTDFLNIIIAISSLWKSSASSPWFDDYCWKHRSSKVQIVLNNSTFRDSYLSKRRCSIFIEILITRGGRTTAVVTSLGSVSDTLSDTTRGASVRLLRAASCIDQLAAHWRSRPWISTCARRRSIIR